VAVNVVPDLFAEVAEDAVLATFQVAFDQVTQEAMQFHAGMIGSGQATPAQRAGRQPEISTIFLDHHIGGDLRSAEQGMLGLVDRKVLRNPVFEFGIIVIPAGCQLLKADGIRSIAVDFVGAHVNQRRFRASLTDRFQ